MAAQTNVLRVVAEAQLAALERAISELQQLGSTVNRIADSLEKVSPAAANASAAINKTVTAETAAAASGERLERVNQRVELSYVKVQNAARAAAAAAARPILPRFQPGIDQPRATSGQFRVASDVERLDLALERLPQTARAALGAIDQLGRGAATVLGGLNRVGDGIGRGFVFAAEGADAAVLTMRRLIGSVQRDTNGAITSVSGLRGAWLSLTQPLAVIRDETGAVTQRVGLLARAIASIGAMPGGTALIATLQGIGISAGAAMAGLRGLVGFATAAGGAIGGLLGSGAVAAGRAITGLGAAAVGAAAGGIRILIGSAEKLGAVLLGVVTTGARTAAGAISGMAGVAASVGAGISNSLGMVSIALGAIGVGAVAAGSSFEQNMNRVFALADTSRDQFNVLREQVLQLGREIPLSLSQLAEGFYYVVSAGISVKDSFDVLRVSAMAAAAGQADLGVVADGVTSVILAYGTAMISASQAADILTRAVVLGKTEYDTFAHSIGRVLPLAAQLQIGFDEVAASLAVMTRLGLNSDEAATALRAVFNSLTAPAKESIKQLKEFGLTTVQVRDMLANKGIIYTLKLLYNAANGNIDVLDRIIPNIRGLTGFLTLANSQADEYDQVLQSIRDGQQGAGATAQAFSRSLETLHNQLILIWNQLNIIAVRFYDALRDPLIASAKAISGFLDKITHWIELNPRLFQQMARITATVVALGTALFGLSIIGRFLAPLIGLFAMFGVMSSRGSASVIGFSGLMRAFTIPITILAAAWIALNAQIADNVKGLAGLKPWLQDLGGIFTSLIGIVQQAAGALSDAFRNVFSPGSGANTERSFGALFDLLMIRVQIFATDLVQLFRDLGPRIVRALRSWISGIGDWARTNLPRVGFFVAALASLFVDWVAKTLPRVYNALRDWAGRIVNWIRTEGIPVLTSGVRYFSMLFVNWLSNIDWEGLRTRLWGYATRIGGWIKDEFAPWLAARFKEIAPAIGGFVGSIPDRIGAFGSSIAPSLAKMFAGLGRFLSSALPVALASAGDIIPAILSWVGGVIAQVVPAVARMATAFFSWVGEVWPQMVAGLNNLKESLVDWIISVVPGVARTLDQWARSFWSWVGQVWPGVRDGLLAFVSSFLGFLGEAVPKIATALAQWSEAFFSWAMGIVLHIPDAMGAVVDAIIGAINRPGAVEHIGQALAEWTVAFTGWAVTKFLPAALIAIQAVIGRLIGEIALDAVKLGGALVLAIPRLLQGMAKALEEVHGPAKILAAIILTGLVVAIGRLALVLTLELIGRIALFGRNMMDAYRGMQHWAPMMQEAAQDVPGLSGALGRLAAKLKNVVTEIGGLYTSGGGGLKGIWTVAKGGIDKLVGSAGLGAVVTKLTLVGTAAYLLYTAWNEDWLGMRTAVDNVAEGIGHVLSKFGDFLRQVTANTPLEIPIKFIAGEGNGQGGGIGSIIDAKTLEDQFNDAFKLHPLQMTIDDLTVGIASGGQQGMRFDMDQLQKAFGISYDEAQRRLVDFVNKHPEYAGRLHDAIWTMLGNTISEGAPIKATPKVEISAQWEHGSVVTSEDLTKMRETFKANLESAFNVPMKLDLASGIRSQRQAIQDGIDQLIEDMVNPESIKAEQKKLQGLLDAVGAGTAAAAQKIGGDAGRKLWEAFNDPKNRNDPVIQSQADAVVAMIKARLGILPQDATVIGEISARNMAKALVENKVTLPEPVLPPDTSIAYDAGTTIAGQYGQGITDSTAPETAAAALAARTRTALINTLVGVANAPMPAFMKGAFQTSIETIIAAALGGDTQATIPAPDVSAFGPAGSQAMAAFAAGIRSNIKAATAAGVQAVKFVVSMMIMRSVFDGQAPGVFLSGRFAAGIRSGGRAASAAAAAVVNSAVGAMSGGFLSRILAYAYGFRTGKAWADGMAAGVRTALATVYAILYQLRRLLQAFSPPGPESPLHQIGDWGFRTMMAYASGIAAAEDSVVAAARGVIGSAAGVLGHGLSVSPTVEFSAVGVGAQGDRSVPMRVRSDGMQSGEPDQRVLRMLADIASETHLQNQQLARWASRDETPAGPLKAHSQLAMLRSQSPARR